MLLCSNALVVVGRCPSTSPRPCFGRRSRFCERIAEGLWLKVVWQLAKRCGLRQRNHRYEQISQRPGCLGQTEGKGSFREKSSWEESGPVRGGAFCLEDCDDRQRR